MNTNKPDSGCEGCKDEHANRFSEMCAACIRSTTTADRYQSAAKRITIGDHSFPEPVLDAPDHGTEYWFCYPAYGSVNDRKWANSSEDMAIITNTGIQLTEQGAQDQLAAMQAMSKGQR